MTFITADRIKETTTVTGTGPITLLGAVSGYRSFASVMEMFGDTCPYAIVNADASQWEVGIATYTDDNTLTRTTIHASTADPNTEPVDFAAGVKDVFLAPTARTVLSDLTSNDGTVILTKVGSVVDLSVAIAAATENVVVQVRNNTGATLTKGTVVYINDALGQLPTVAKALATSDATSAQTLGMISADLDNNSNGYVTIIGLIDDISLDTGIYSDGDQLYLSGTTAGAFTNVKPYAPTHLVYVGVVEHAHNVHGKVFVKVQNGYELDELHNVSAQSPSNGQTIVYNSTNQLWEKNTVSLTAGVNDILPVTNGGTGVTTATGTGSVVRSTAPTLTTATFAAGTISASTPNTITQTWNNAAVTFSALTVNVTDVASGTGSTNQLSRMLDLQKGGSSLLRFDSKGTLVFGQGNSWATAATGEVAVANEGGRFTFSGPSNARYVGIGSGSWGSGLLIRSSSWLGFHSDDTLSNFFTDTKLSRDAAGALALSNSTNPQAFRVYNTYTDASNYERLVATWASNICTIGLEQAGTGLPRTLNVNANALNAPALPVAATVTAASGNGTTVTYTCASNFAIGQVVSITGLTITTGSSLNLSNQTITGVTATTFTVANTTVGTAAATQAGTATIQSAGNSVTITAGNGSGVGAGGNIILQPGAQGTSGGNGKVLFYSSAGAQTGYWDTNSSILYGGDTLSINSKLRINGAGYIMPFGTGIVFATSNTATTYICTIPDQYGFKMNRNGLYGFSNDVWGSNWTSAATDSGIGRADFGVTCVIRDTAKNGGSLSFPSTTTNFSADTNDLALTASAFQRINCTVASSLTGIAPPTGGAHVNGRMIRIYNVGTANLTLSHNSTSSAAANRFFNATGTDIILAPNDYAELIYDSTSNGSGAAGWRVS